MGWGGAVQHGDWLPQGEEFRVEFVGAQLLCWGVLVKEACAVP